jgi:hypothetical protein
MQGGRGAAKRTVAAAGVAGIAAAAGVDAEQVVVAVREAVDEGSDAAETTAAAAVPRDAI